MTNEKTIYDLLNDMTTDLSEYDVQSIDELQQKRMQTMVQQIVKEHPKTKEIEKREKNAKENRLLRKPAVAVAALVFCVCLTGTTTFAAPVDLQGFFTDIFGKNGAVVGTEYKQATEEIDINIVAVTHQLTVELTMVNADKAPYREFEQFGIERYEIVDVNGNVIVEGTALELADMADGKVFVHIPLDSLPTGDYKLIVSEMAGSKKADQPLTLYGNWDCAFTK